MCIVTEELSRACAGVATTYSANALAAMPIILFAREYLVAYVLGRIDLDMKVDICRKLLALPLVHSLYQAQDAEQVSMPVLMFWLLLMGWNLLVVAHIIRHALSVILPVGVAIAVLYTLIAMQLITALFPPPN